MPSTAHLVPFDSQAGREAGIKSAEVRLELMELGRQNKAVITADQEEQAALTADCKAEVQRQIDLCNDLIAGACARIKDDKACYCEHCERGGIGDKERAALIRESRGLMEHLCRLKGIAEAPRTQPLKSPSRAPRRAVAEPMALPQPVAQAEPVGPAEKPVG